MYIIIMKKIENVTCATSEYLPPYSTCPIKWENISNKNQTKQYCLFGRNVSSYNRSEKRV